MFVRPNLYVAGSWVEPRVRHFVGVVEAATEESIGQVALGSEADIDAAVSAARDALTGPWAELGPSERADILDRFAAELRRRGRETARLVSRENGMPITLSKSVNGVGPAAMLTYYADLIRHTVAEEERPGSLGNKTVVRREPVGVVAVITPWNYPQPLAAMKIAPALAAGCTVVLKPSPETALDAYVFADAAGDAGVPDGVLNVVPADREASAYLVAHPGVDKVAFTGSTITGRRLGAVCGELLRPATLELGGKSAAIVTDDADLDVFTGNLLDVCLANNGQTCHASTRILASQRSFSAVVDAVTETVRTLRVGDPLSPETDIGPLVSAAQRDKVLEYIESGRSEGYTITTGGGRPTSHGKGWFVEPTVFAGVDNCARIAREEIFGPVLTIIEYRDEEDAIAIANDSEYGLGGTVWCTDEERGVALARRIRSGTVGVNHYALDLNAPFGGVKASGLGRELGPEGIRPYLVDKSIYLGTR